MPRSPAVLAALTLVGAGALPGPAGAATDGGGVMFVPQPEIRSVKCVKRCATRKRARAGSAIRIAGRMLTGVRRVVFLGDAGRGDDVSVIARVRSSRRVEARVPFAAIAGPVTVETTSGLRARRSRPLAILPPPPPAPNPTLTAVPGPRQPGAPAVETGTSRTRVYFGARRAVVFSYRLSAPATVQVDLVRAADGAAVRSWTPGPVAAGSVGSIVWNGAVGRTPAPRGRYSFRLTARGASGAVARSAQAPTADRDAFDLYADIFPVRGRHDFGQAGARFGAGRAGHIHQGQDVMARCGTRMVAARGGRVKTSRYHRLAGYYLVINADGTGVDYVYAHLRERSAFQEGDRVYTGQRIGAVGASGNARGCHLHFELWNSPGWYDGGRPFDPLPSLQSWDAYS